MITKPFYRAMPTFVLISIFALLVGCGSDSPPIPADEVESSAPPATEAPEVEPTAVPTEVEAEPTPIPPTAEPEPDPEPTEEPTEAPEESSANVETNDSGENRAAFLDAVWQSDPNELPFDTFVYLYTFEVTSESGETQSMQIRIENDQVNNRMLMIPTAVGLSDMEGFGDVVMGLTENGSFISSPETGCIFVGQAVSPMDELFVFDTETLFDVESRPSVEYIGPETIYGLDTVAYSFGKEVFESEDYESGEILEGSGKLNLYELDDGSVFMVRMESELITTENMFVGEEIADGSEQFTTTFLTEIQNINEPLDIVLPAGCEGEPTEQTDYPIYDGAEIQFSMPQGTSMLIADVTLAEVVEWYKEAMAADGWTEQESFEMETMASMSFERNGEIVSVNVLPDPGSGQINVIIAGEE